MGQAESLAGYGFNHKEQLSTLGNFSRQLESYALHVIEDRPVSNAYSYFFDKGKIFIDREKKTELFVDPEERGGLAQWGTIRALDQALAHPGELVLFYSPPGPVAFETGTKFDKIKPYTDGQLYLLVGTAEDQVDAIAISVGKDNESKTIKSFFGEQNLPGGFDNEQERIKYFLTNPLSSGRDMENLLLSLKTILVKDNFSVYKNVHQEEFKILDVFKDLVQGWLRRIKPKVTFDYRKMYEAAKAVDVKSVYLYQLKNYFPIYGQNGKMALGGGCGGNIVSEGELSSFDPLPNMKQVDILSSDYRMSTSLKDIIKKSNEESDEYGSLKFHCPVCNGEHTRPRHVLFKVCPNPNYKDKKGRPIPIPKC